MTVPAPLPPHTHTENCCRHCGDPCGADKVVRDALEFCCQGCSTVHQLLASHQLEGFYQLDKKAGVSLKGAEVGQRYAFLDHTEIQQKLLLFSNGHQAKARFYLPQIHCASCLWLLEKLPWLDAGIQEAKVNYLRKEVLITFKEGETSLRKLAELLASLGYAPHITLDSEEDTAKRPTSGKRFYYQIGVAGFCMGNIMLLSFPEYLGLATAADKAEYIGMFGFLNILLGLPLFLFSAQPYWISAYHALKNKGVNMDVPIALGILALFLRSTYEIISHTGSGYFDSLGMLIFLLLVGKWFQQRTFGHLSFERDYRSYFPIAVTKIENGQEVPTPLEKIKQGDIVQVRNGELIPADAWIRKGEGRIDYSFITGEAEPIDKQEGELIYAGGRQQGGMLTLELAKNVSQSYLTQLWNADAFQKGGKKGLKNITDQVGQRFTIVVLILATVATAYWWTISPGKAIEVCTAILIIACPCALALNIPFALGNTLRLMARKGLFVKDTDVIERMSEASQLVFDKTGTIATAGKVHFEGAALSEAEKAMAKTLCSHSAHPLSQEIASSIHTSEAVCYEVEGFKETTAQGIEALVGDHFLKLGKAEFVGWKDGAEESFKTRVYLSVNGVPKGFFELQQEVRTGVAGLLARLKKTFGLALLSGDKEGEKLRMEELFGKDAPLRFRQSPADKMAYIEGLQQNGETVVMLGDGLNDAGALRQSHVGIAVSDSVHQFSPACDAILQANALQNLDQFLWMSRRAVRIVRSGFLLSLCYNVVGVSFAVKGLLQPVIGAILMPLSSFTVVGFVMVATTLAAKKVMK